MKQNNHSIINLYFIVLAAFTGIITISIAKIQISPKKIAKTSNSPYANTAKAISQIKPQSRIVNLTTTQNSSETKVSRLLVVEGSKVSKGETIAQLNSHQQANAAVESAFRQVKVAQKSL